MHQVESNCNGWNSAVLFLFLGALILGAVPLWCQQEVTGVEGSDIELSVGSDSGVRPNMTGRVFISEIVGGSPRKLEIATFVVLHVEPDESTAKVTGIGDGWELSLGLAVEFDQPLVQPERNTATVVIRSNVTGDIAFIDGRRLGPTPQKIEVTPGRHDIRVEKPGYSNFETSITSSLSETETVVAALQRLASDPVTLARNANEAFEAMEWGKAASLYSQLLNLVPDDEIALKKLGEAQEMVREEKENLALKAQVEMELPHAGYYLQQADNAYRAGNFDDAANYYKTVSDVSARYYQALNKYYLSRARAYGETGDLKAAENSMRSFSAVGLPAELQKDSQNLIAQIENLAPHKNLCTSWGSGRSPRQWYRAVM